MRCRWLIMVAMVLLAPVAARGEMQIETFADYAGMDPFQTPADWNIFDQQVELPKVEAYSNDFILGLVELEGGDMVVLLLRFTLDESIICLQKLDSLGNRLLPPEGVEVFSSAGYSFASICRLGPDRLAACWLEETGVYEVDTQIYDTDLNAIWPHPARANQGTGVATIDSGGMGIAGLSDGGFVVTWSDDRSGIMRVYAQRMSATGAPQWGSADALPSATGVTAQLWPRIATDSQDRTFLLWRESNTDSDVMMGRLGPSGASAWDPGIPVPCNSTEDEEDFDFTVIDGVGLFATWRESSGSSSVIHAMRRGFDGSAGWGTDTVVDVNGQWNGRPRIEALPDGNLLVCFSTIQGLSYHLRSQAVQPDGSLAGLWAPLIELPPHQPLIYFETCPRSTGGALLGIGTHDFVVGNGQVLAVDADGETSWPAPRRIRKPAGSPVAMSASLVQNSGAARGFSAVWSDTREGGLRPFARAFSDPGAPAGDRDHPLGSASGESLNARSCQLADGTRAVVWRGIGASGPQLAARWYGTGWEPLWGSDLIISTASSSYWDICADSSGRIMCVWTIDSGSSAGVYLQGFTSGSSLVYPSPIRVDGAPAGQYFGDARVSPYGDGSLAVAWSDTRTGPYRPYARRIQSSGVPAWPADVLISDPATSGPGRLDIQVIGTELIATYVASSGGFYGLRGRILDASGVPVYPEGIASADYDWIDQVSMSSFDGDPIWVFEGESGGGDGIYFQRLYSGTTLPSDMPVSNLTDMEISSLDLIQTSPQRIAVCFSASWSDELISRLQELDPLGVRQYVEDLPLVPTEPVVHGYSYAVSSSLSTDSGVAWAMLEPTHQVPAGTQVEYFFSYDGGWHWFPAAPGEIVAFPSGMSDLRWGVDLWSDPGRQISPEVTEVELYWGNSEISVELLLNQTMFEAGDTFSMRRMIGNAGLPVEAGEFVILDVYGEFWFWPSWDQDLDGEYGILPTRVELDTILEFQWPPDAGSAAGIRFWAALLDPVTMDLLCPVHMVEFGYR